MMESNSFKATRRTGEMGMIESSKKHCLHNVLEHPEKLSKIPYKTCRFLILLWPFSQNGTQKYQKALGLSVKVDAVLRFRKTSKKHWLHNVLEQPKKLIKIPYKTCRL